MNSSLSSLDNGQADDSNSSNGESIQCQISKLFEEIISLHDLTTRRKNAPKWYGQLDNIITNINSLTNTTNNNNSKQLTQSLKKRKRTEKEEKETEKERPKSVTSEFKWASDKPIRLNQSAQRRMEALSKQLEIEVDLSACNNKEKTPKFKPVKPVIPKQEPGVSMSPMKDISNTLKKAANSNIINSKDADDDNFDDDDDEFLRNLDVTNLVSGDETF